jgi:hypothetical protein
LQPFEPHCFPVQLGVQVPAHCPLVHVCPSPHAWQAAPLVPHSPRLVPVWQAPVESTQPLQVVVLLQAPALSQTWVPVHT